jgi:uncharacterized protein with PIN domain
MVVAGINVANSLPFTTRMPTTFATERTLGRLNKWLRLMGFDTLSENEYPQGSFMQRIGPERIFLTRTQRLQGASIGLKTIFIRANDPAEQIEELIAQTGLRPQDIRAFSRCIVCNEPIRPVAKSAVAGSVPDYVWNTRTDFSACPKCGRVYWQGSHTERALQRLSGIFPAREAAR